MTLMHCVKHLNGVTWFLTTELPKRAGLLYIKIGSGSAHIKADRHRGGKNIGWLGTISFFTVINSVVEFNSGHVRHLQSAMYHMQITRVCVNDLCTDDRRKSYK